MDYPGFYFPQKIHPDGWMNAYQYLKAANVRVESPDVLLTV